jgi:hypothetical protein
VELNRGTRLGSYQIQSSLGAGGILGLSQGSEVLDSEARVSGRDSQRLIQRSPGSGAIA